MLAHCKACGKLTGEERERRSGDIGLGQAMRREFRRTVGRKERWEEGDGGGSDGRDRNVGRNGGRGNRKGKWREGWVRELSVERHRWGGRGGERTGA